MKKRYLLIAAVILLMVAIPIVAAERAGTALPGGPGARAYEIAASGFIEADEVSIAAEYGGRIRDLPVREGDGVVAGGVLALMDDAMLEKQINQGQAAVELARANLALVKAGARPEEVQQRRAALAQAETIREGARKAWDNAVEMRNNPQDLNARVSAARGQLAIAERNVDTARQARDNAIRDQAAAIREAQAALKAAELQVDQARINVDQAEKLKLALHPPVTTENWIRPPWGVQDPLQYDLNVYQWQLAQEALGLALANRELAQARLDRAGSRSPVDLTTRQHEAAVAARDSARVVLEDLLGTRQNPLVLKSQVDAAEANYRQALAATDMAQAALDASLAGATKEQLALAEAQVTQAESALATLQARREDMTITSPVSGMVARKIAQKGEIVLPGASILKVVDLRTVTLKVFVPESDIGQLKLGSAAYVSVDSYPERRFPGRVTFVSPQAEFTPRDIQTKEERARTVFAVKITLDNPEGILKPGMPADASVASSQ
ncbi:MAG: efflux RND transporter periplasmic adaptor subunit [Chloroflexi bacterium]|nr:efflux RND transporter periplasmic adaptor subunit [Chloroflexota bacterium]